MKVILVVSLLVAGSALFVTPNASAVCAVSNMACVCTNIGNCTDQFGAQCITAVSLDNEQWFGIVCDLG